MISIWYERVRVILKVESYTFALKKKVYWINKLGGCGVPLSYVVEWTLYVIQWIHFVVMFLLLIYKIINSIKYCV